MNIIHIAKRVASRYAEDRMNELRRELHNNLQMSSFFEVTDWRPMHYKAHVRNAPGAQFEFTFMATKDEGAAIGVSFKPSKDADTIVKALRYKKTDHVSQMLLDIVNLSKNMALEYTS